MNVLTSTTSNIYDILILNKYVRPTVLDRWQGIYYIEDNDSSDIFKLCYICTRETKLQSRQFKIVHRIIPCKKWLHDQNAINYELNKFWNVFENW